MPLQVLVLPHSYANGLGMDTCLSLSELPSFCPPQAWAIYKGKYHEGLDKADPSVWKTRLRCALNKSTDFQEVPEQSHLDISEPYKVYRIVSQDTGMAGFAQDAPFRWKKQVDVPSLTL